MSPDRLADPEALRRFEYQAREVMADLSNRYAQSVSVAATSVVLAIPATGLSRPGGDHGIDPARRFSGRSWVTLPKDDPAAVRLIEAARAVDVSAIKLTQPGPLPERLRPGSVSAVAARPDPALRARQTDRGTSRE